MSADGVRERLLTADLREQVRVLEKQLELYRLASPERTWRLERLCELQRELIGRMRMHEGA